MRYRLRFETVATTHLGRYSNADPTLYANTVQTVPNSQIPDEHWHEVKREADDIDDVLPHYWTLRRWAEADEEFVRNVRLDQAPDPEWEPVNMDAT